jgi:hypothetical protein
VLDIPFQSTGTVNSMAKDGNIVYLGGAFNTLSGAARDAFGYLPAAAPDYSLPGGTDQLMNGQTSVALLLLATAGALGAIIRRRQVTLTLPKGQDELTKL